MYRRIGKIQKRNTIKKIYKEPDESPYGWAALKGYRYDPWARRYYDAEGRERIRYI